jgi:hypothetical protein
MTRPSSEVSWREVLVGVALLLAGIVLLAWGWGAA